MSRKPWCLLGWEEALQDPCTRVTGSKVPHLPGTACVSAPRHVCGWLGGDTQQAAAGAGSHCIAGALAPSATTKEGKPREAAAPIKFLAWDGELRRTVGQAPQGHLSLGLRAALSLITIYHKILIALFFSLWDASRKLPKS